MSESEFLAALDERATGVWHRFGGGGRCSSVPWEDARCLLTREEIALALKAHCYETTGPIRDDAGQYVFGEIGMMWWGVLVELLRSGDLEATACSTADPLVEKSVPRQLWGEVQLSMWHVAPAQLGLRGVMVRRPAADRTHTVPASVNETKIAAGPIESKPTKAKSKRHHSPKDWQIDLHRLLKALAGVDGAAPLIQLASLKGKKLFDRLEIEWARRNFKSPCPKNSSSDKRTKIRLIIDSAAANPATFFDKPPPV